MLWGENAPGLFLALGAALVPRLRALAQQFGYSFSMVKTDTALHGLPQHRQRTFYFFWRSGTAPLLRWVRRPCPDLLLFLQSIPPSAPYQDIFVQEGSVTERFKPYQYVLLREGLNHAQFAAKMAEENNGTITVSKYLDKHNLLEDCISWMKLYFPQERWSTKVGRGAGRGRTIVDYLEHCQEKLSRGLGYWDDSPKFMGNTFTAVITKNVVFAVHPAEDRFLNIRELMHLMGLPHDYVVENPLRNWNHVCQNVPVDTAAAWAHQVVAFCRGELQLSQHQFIKQDNLKQEVVAREGTIKVEPVEIKQEEGVMMKQEEYVVKQEPIESFVMKQEVKEEDMEDDCVPSLPPGNFRTFAELAMDFLPQAKTKKEIVQQIKKEPAAMKAKKETSANFKIEHLKQNPLKAVVKTGVKGEVERKPMSLWEASGSREEVARPPHPATRQPAPAPTTRPFPAPLPAPPALQPPTSFTSSLSSLAMGGGWGVGQGRVEVKAEKVRLFQCSVCRLSTFTSREAVVAHHPACLQEMARRRREEGRVEERRVEGKVLRCGSCNMETRDCETHWMKECPMVTMQVATA